jgi:hypothetical protein
MRRAILYTMLVDKWLLLVLGSSGSETLVRAGLHRAPVTSWLTLDENRVRIARYDAAAPT